MAITQKMRVSRRAELAPPSPVRKLMPLAFAALSRGVSVLHTNIGQPDIPMPEAIAAGIRGYGSELLPYAPSRGFPESLEAWSAYYAVQGYPVQPDDLMVTTGGSEALWFAFMTVADFDEEILVFEPTYANYFGFAVEAGIRMRAVSLDPEDGFHLPSRAAIEAQLTDRVRAICIANPNNPTGTVYDRSELEMLAEIALQHDLFLISDETYRELVFDGLQHTSMLEFETTALQERVIIVDSVSKRFSATGARVGCIVSRNPDVMDAVGRFGQARLSTPTVEQLAVNPMLRAPTEYTTWLRSVYQGRRDVVFDRLCSAGILCQKPSGAFYIMVTLPVDDSDRFAAWLLTDFESKGETVMIAPGSGFYLTPGMGSDQARLAYVLNETDLGRAVDILVEAVHVYPGATA